MTAGPFPHLPTETWELYLDDALAGPALARVDSHLAACPACRAVLVQADASRAFRALRVPAPEPTWEGFWEELQPRLGVAAAARARRRRAAFLVAGAAASLVLAVVALRPEAPPAAGPACSQASLAALHLTREECEALHSGPIESPEGPVIVVRDDLDLRGL